MFTSDSSMSRFRGPPPTKIFCRYLVSSASSFVSTPLRFSSRILDTILPAGPAGARVWIQLQVAMMDYEQTNHARGQIRTAVVIRHRRHHVLSNIISC